MSRIWSRPWFIAVTLIAAALGSMAIAIIAIDRIGESIIDAQAKSAAAAEQDYMVTLAREEGLAALVDTLNRRERLHGGDGFRYALTDTDGHAIAGASTLSTISASKGWKVGVTQVRGEKKTWHVLVGALPSGQSLFIAQDAEHRASFRSAILDASAAALIFASIACTLAGFLLSGYLLRRTTEISRTAEQIAAGNLEARVAVGHSSDVFDRLGGSINAMLERIEELMTGMRTITDSLAHDLRRPLTRVENALERAANPETTEDDRIDAIAQAKEQTESALATFSALIDIARAEAGLSAETMTNIDLAALLADVAELFEPVFEDADQHFHLDVPETPVAARVHEPLLRQAVGNLLHNASIYAGHGATIALSLQPQPGGVDIIVADNGPGIPEADRGRVKERFVRLDPARTAPGSGLGLAIAAACAKLQDGALLLEDNAPGLRATLQLRRQT